MAGKGANVNPIGMANEIVKFDAFFTRAIKETVNSCDSIRSLCTNQFKTKKFYDLGNDLFIIASSDGGFLSCVNKAATDCKSTVEAILKMKAYADDDAVKSAVKKAVATLDGVISATKGSEAKLSAMKSETVEGSKITEPHKGKFVESVKKLSKIRENFINDLADATKKIEDKDLCAVLRKSCVSTERDCNELCKILKKHNEVMEELGLDINSVITNVSASGTKSAIKPERVKAAKL